MIGNEIELWNKLRKYYIFKIKQVVVKERKKFDKYAENIDGVFVEKEGYMEEGIITRQVESHYSPFWICPHFLDFTLGINRAISFYPKILKINSSEDLLRYKNTLLYDSAFLFIINALENYLISTFRFLADGMYISRVNKNILFKFIKEFNIQKKFFEKLEEHDSLGFPLSELIPERLDILQKKKCRIAFRLLDINLPELKSKIWEKIFTIEPSGYMQRRNKIIHATFQLDIQNINEINIKKELEYLENGLLDMVEFVHDIEWIRLRIRPDPIEVSLFDKFLSGDHLSHTFENFKEVIIKGIEKQRRESNSNEPN